MRGVVNIMKKLLLFLVLIFAIPMQVYAAAPRDIPYAHALNRAISWDSNVAPLDREIRQADARVRNLLEEYLSLVNTDRTAADAIYGQRMMEIAERDRLRRSKTRLELSIERALRTLLADIVESEINIELLEANLDFQQRLFEQVELRHSLGMASDMELREARHTLEQTGLSLEMANLALQNQRQELNRLIRQPITADIRVIYNIPDLTPPEQLSDREMQRLIARSHNLLYWREEVEIRRHEWQRQLDDPEVDNSYMRLQHRLAVLERDMAERQAELNIRNSLAEWERLSEQEAVIMADIAQAQADYEDMKSRLEAGLATQLQVDATVLAIAAAEARLVRHSYNFWIAHLEIEFPYISLIGWR